MAWAKFPVTWLRPPQTDGTKVYPLAGILWRDYKASAIAALIVLMLLAIKCNEENRQRQKAKEAEPFSPRARMSYDELQELSGFHRATLGKAISLLEAWGALSVEKNGRSNVYVLPGLDTPGHWRKLPQDPLIAASRFALKALPRSRASLNALKLYLALVGVFNDSLGTSTMSYNAFVSWTGVRREDVPAALSILANYNLVRPSFDRDSRHAENISGEHAQRYWLNGLSRSIRQDLVQGLGSAAATPEQYDL